MQRRVLVTAGGGAVGQELCRQLATNGDIPVPLDERQIGFAEHVYGRTVDGEVVAQAIQDCTHVVHLEWSGSVAEATADPLKRHERNLGPTISLMDHCRAREIPFLFASTATYAGKLPEASHEEMPRNERAIYTIQKSYIESNVRAYAQMFGLKAASLRIFNVYGPGGRDTQIIPRIRASLANGTPIRLTGDGGQQRDFIHVSDVARAFLLALDAPLTGEPINVGTGRGTSMLDLVNLIMDLSGQRVPIEMIPAKGEEARFLFADTRRAEEILGFRASIRLEDGLRGLIP